MGQSATRVGTVETTVTSLATSHGPRSTPLRTSDRGAGTRQAPCAQASHISSHDASKLTDSPAITRSPGPSGRSCRNSRASASTNAAADRCDTATPFGVPVDPEVKMTQASSPGSGSAAVGLAPRPGPGRDHELVPDDGGRVRLVEDRPGALVGVIGVDRDVAGARHQDAHDRDVQVDRARGDAHARPGRRPSTPDRVEGRRDLLGRLGELGVGEHDRPVVQRQLVGSRSDRLLEHLDEGAGLRSTEGSQQGHACPLTESRVEVLGLWGRKLNGGCRLGARRRLGGLGLASTGTPGCSPWVSAIVEFPSVPASAIARLPLGSTMAARIEIFRTDAGDYAFRLRSKDGELIATGESQKTKARARESVLALLKATPKAKIYDLTEIPPIG